MEVRRESCDRTTFLLIGGGLRSRVAEMRLLLRQMQPGCLLRSSDAAAAAAAHVMPPPPAATDDVFMQINICNIG